MTNRMLIKDVLVNFYREGRDSDYLKALNNAIKEMEAIIEASKISSNAVLKVTSDSTENKKESEVLVCSCNKPQVLKTVYGLPDICLYCRKLMRAN